MRLKFLLISLALAAIARAEPIPPDITVAADGSGQFKTVQEAVASIPRDNRERIVILIKDGVYKEKVRVDAACVTLRGQSRAGARIEFPQDNEEFGRNPDQIGRAVVNVNADDFVLENLTVKNTAGVIGPHAFAVYGRGDRTVIIDSDVLSEGADTVSLWKGDTGKYYHARCNFRGSVDFVCPRGWCYLTDCTFYECKNTAAVWHDGSKDKDQKFVLRNCKFDGAEGWVLARHHHDAAFYFLNCTFSQSMTDRAPKRVIYPLNGAEPTDADKKRNADNDKSNIWGERAYYLNCHRTGGDFEWFKDNLPVPPDKVTAAWTFADKWDPESTKGPAISRFDPAGNAITVTFSESVTVKGKPRLAFKDGSSADYDSGSGSDTLKFRVPVGHTAKTGVIDLNQGAIIASEAAAVVRAADTQLPTE